VVAEMGSKENEEVGVIKKSQLADLGIDAEMLRWRHSSNERAYAKTIALINYGGDSYEDGMQSIKDLHFARTPSELGGESNHLNPSVLFFVNLYSGAYLLSTTALFSILLMVCGAIGALIADARGKGMVISLRSPVLGFATGFVVYLALIGGKQVFLLDFGSEVINLNPYSCAFAGLLAGLFSERAYEVLSSLVDEFASRLRG
jgi:hypothetical protein